MARDGVRILPHGTMTVQITIREGQGYINGLPDEVIEPLTLATSFKPAGYQFTKAFQKGHTDGRVKLLKSSKFPAGLVGRVVKVLQKHDVPYRLTVERNEQVKPHLELELVDVDLWQHQIDAIERGILNPRGVIRAPTGGGKTVMIAGLIVALRRHTLVIEPTIDLMYQAIAALERHIMDLSTDDDPTGGAGWGRCLIGQLGDGIVNPQPITVATVRTAAAALQVAFESYEFGEYDDRDPTKVTPSQLREWRDQIGTLIVDEAHILGAQTVFDIATKLPAPNKFGFSASPWRDDGADLMIEGATGPVIYEIPVKTLVDQGILVPPIIEVVDTKGWWTPAAWGSVCSHCSKLRWMTAKGPAAKCTCGCTRWKSEFTDAYRVEIVENVIRNAMIAEKVRTLTGPSLILVKQKKHGRALESLIEGSEFLSGANVGQERADAFQRIRDGKLQHIICTTIADMGLDIPILQNLILAGGGKSSTRHLQRIGRVVRSYPGKTHARVVDFDDGHVHRWFRNHAAARRKIEHAEWKESALWV